MNAGTDCSENPAGAKCELEQFGIAGRTDQRGKAHHNRQGQKHGPLDQLKVGVPDPGIGLPALSEDEQGFLLLDEQGDLIWALEPI